MGKNEEEDKNTDNKATKTAIGNKRKTQEEKMRELKARMEEEEKQKNNPSQAEQMVNILDVMEKKRQRRMAAKGKLSEKGRFRKSLLRNLGTWLMLKGMRKKSY